jgi:hypothetical protein
VIRIARVQRIVGLFLFMQFISTDRPKLQGRGEVRLDAGDLLRKLHGAVAAGWHERVLRMHGRLRVLTASGSCVSFNAACLTFALRDHTTSA